MSKTNKKQYKKKDNLEKTLVNEDSNAKSLLIPHNTSSIPTIPLEIDTKLQDIGDNKADTLVKSKKKKKKKKKKTHSESETSLPDVDNNSSQTSEVTISSDMVDLMKLPELTVIKLPQPTESNIEPECKLVNENTDASGDSSASKKQKKKKKKSIDNASYPEVDVQQGVKQINPLTTDTTHPFTDVPPVTNQSNPSYFKVTQSHNSTVFLVSNPTENVKKDTGAEKVQEKSSATITMTPDAQYLIKNPDHINLQNHLLHQMGKNMLSQLPAATQSSSFVSLTPIVDGTNLKMDNLQNVSQTSVNPYNPDSFEANSNTQKSKAQLKAERRAIQEAQRAAKEASKRASNAIDNQLLSKPAVSKQMISAKTVNKVKVLKEGQKSFFFHLPQFKSSVLLEKHLQSDDFIHPAVISVGAQYAKDNIAEPNVCCIEVLKALKSVIKDYKTPPNKELRRDLGSKLEQSISFLSKCRPFSVGTLNALKFLKLQVGNISENQADDRAKQNICDYVNKYIRDSIYLAVEAISGVVSSEIKDGDIILTYGYSSVVKDALCKAQEQNKHFKVIIIDSRPTLESKRTLNSLLKEGISCSYALMSALTYAMKEVTKVIIGAHAVRASGYVMSRIGSSQIALLASSLNIPFLVCCESYKFCERALIDSFVDNEIGDPESFVKPNITQSNITQSNILENWKDISHLDLINLLYDVTPPYLISKVITEK